MGLPGVAGGGLLPALIRLEDGEREREEDEDEVRKSEGEESGKKDRELEERMWWKRELGQQTDGLGEGRREENRHGGTVNHFDNDRCANKKTEKRYAFGIKTFDN